jgi:hypothetical protein
VEEGLLLALFKGFKHSDPKILLRANLFSKD